MAVCIHFKPENMSRDAYEQVFRELQAVGQDTTPARLSHVCIDRDGTLEVIDVWASIEEFQAFGATLMPILGKLGVTLPPPSISPAIHVMAGGTHHWF